MKHQTINRIAVIAALLLFASAAFAAVEGSFDRTLKLTGPLDLEVSTGSGYIHVTTGPAGTMSLKAHVRVNERWSGGDSAEARLQRILANPPIEQSGNNVRIGHSDDHELYNNVSITYDLVVPAETRLASHTGSGDQDIADIRGPLEASTGSGSMKIGAIGGTVRASTGSGDVTVRGAMGNTRVTTGSGSVHASRIAGPFEGSSGSGTIQVEQTAAGSVRVSTGSGSIQVAGAKGGVTVGTGSGDVQVEGEPAGDWRVETASGSVRLTLPPNAGFDFAAHSSSGSINIADAHQMTVSGTIGRHDFRGKAHGGGNLVEVRTASGSISVR